MVLNFGYSGQNRSLSTDQDSNQRSGESAILQLPLIPVALADPIQAVTDLVFALAQNGRVTSILSWLLVQLHRHGSENISSSFSLHPEAQLSAEF